MPRKRKTWAVAPRPGPHKKLQSVPLQVLLRDVLNILEKGSEARAVIRKGEVLVDGKKRKDHAYPVGLFDIVSIPTIGKNYRAVPSGKMMSFVEVPESESKLKICKIIDKSVTVKGKMQLNLHDGKNILTDKKEFKTGDSLVVELPGMKITSHVPLESGVVGVVTKGSEVGRVGKVKGIKPATSREGAKVTCMFGKEEMDILKDRFFVVGKDKPLIKLGD